jgi:hypothetical protein
MVETIKAGERQLNDVFCDKYQFEIPPYQRPYAWTTSEAETLLDDLLVASEGAGPVAELAPYFLGSIVVIKQGESPKAEVIDGQQRLTTLVIMFSVLRSLLEDPARKSADRFILQRGDFAAGTEDTFRLTVRQRDSEFFRDHIQMGTPYAGPPLRDSQGNMMANYERLKGRLEKESEERRGRLLQFTAQRCFLVVVEASDRASAYRVFSVMNNRGLDLTATDILKADVVGAIPEDRQEAYNEKWEDIEEDLGREAFGDLFAHIRMIHQKAKSRATLEAEFRQHVNPTVRPQQFIDDELKAAANAYEVILSRTVDSPQYGTTINRLLGGLSLLDNYDFLRRLDRLAYSLFIRREDINARINRYAAILRAMEDGTDIQSEGLLGLSDAAQKQTLEALDGPIYEVKRISKQVLLRLDEATSEGSAKYDLPVVTIEHVLPQNPKQDGPWMELFPDEEERAEWTHRLGNLVLLSRYKNASASNWSFEEKKNKYFTTTGSTPFSITSQVLAKEQWTPSVVAQRQKECIQTLADLWDLKNDQ